MDSFRTFSCKPVDRSYSPPSWFDGASQSDENASNVGTADGVQPASDRSSDASQGSMLVWARPGPRADAQARWTAALARGLNTEVSLVDVVESSVTPSSGNARGEDELQDHLAKRRGGLRRHAHAEFADVTVDCRVCHAPSAETTIIEMAASEQHDAVVLWAPVPERMIRDLLQQTPSTVFVIRCPRLRPDLPWTVTVADADKAARRVAQVLIQGSDEEADLHVEPAIDADTLDDVPGQVVCVTRPMPGWAASSVLRRARTATSDKTVVERYNASSVGSKG